MPVKVSGDPTCAEVAEAVAVRVYLTPSKNTADLVVPTVTW